MGTSTMYIVQGLSHQDGLWTDLGALFDHRDKAERHLALERANDATHEFRLIERTETVLDPEQAPMVAGFELPNGEVAYYRV